MDKFTIFEDMYAKLWALIYAILEMFGIVRDENGNLTDAE